MNFLWDFSTISNRARGTRVISPTTSLFCLSFVPLLTTPSHSLSLISPDLRSADEGTMTADEEDDDRVKHPKISTEQAPLTTSITFTASYFSEPADPLVRRSPSPPPASPSPLITITTSALVPELADPLVLRRQSSLISASRSLSSSLTLSPSLPRRSTTFGTTSCWWRMWRCRGTRFQEEEKLCHRCMYVLV